MSKTTLVGDFLYGYLPNGERELIPNTAEQIAAFIMEKHNNGMLKVVNIYDVLEISTLGYFVDSCADQQFLQNELLPVLIPIQLGEVEAPKFVPYVDEKYIIKNVRTPIFEEGKYQLMNVDYSDGITQTPANDEKFDTEEELRAAYPDSLCIDEARYIINATPYTREDFIEEFVESLSNPINAQDLLGVSDDEFALLWNLSDDAHENFKKQVTAKVNAMSLNELLEFTMKYDMYIKVTE